MHSLASNFLAQSIFVKSVTSLLGIRVSVAIEVVFTYIRTHSEYVTPNKHPWWASGWRENSEICTVYFFAFNHSILLIFVYLQQSLKILKNALKIFKRYNY